MLCIECRTQCDKTDYGFWVCPKCNWSTGQKTFAGWLRFDVVNKKRIKRIHQRRHRQTREWLLSR